MNWEHGTKLEKNEQAKCFLVTALINVIKRKWEIWHLYRLLLCHQKFFAKSFFPTGNNCFVLCYFQNGDIPDWTEQHQNHRITEKKKTTIKYTLYLPVQLLDAEQTTNPSELHCLGANALPHNTQGWRTKTSPGCITARHTRRGRPGGNWCLK